MKKLLLLSLLSFITVSAYADYGWISDNIMEKTCGCYDYSKNKYVANSYCTMHAPTYKEFRISENNCNTSCSDSSGHDEYSMCMGRCTEDLCYL